jgi:hypothetical protein
MKKIITLLLFLFAMQTFIFGQVYKYRTTQISMKVGNNDWGEWEESEILLIVNLNDQRITIHSSKIQKYDIVTWHESYRDKDGDTNYSFTCVDQDGDYCTVTHCLCESQNGRNQLYIRFNNITWVYYMRKLD